MMRIAPAPSPARSSSRRATNARKITSESSGLELIIRRNVGAVDREDRGPASSTRAVRYARWPVSMLSSPRKRPAVRASRPRRRRRGRAATISTSPSRIDDEVVVVVAGAVEHVAGRDGALGPERRELGQLGLAERRRVAASVRCRSSAMEGGQATSLTRSAYSGCSRMYSRDERATRHDAQPAAADVVEHRARELAGQAVVLELGEDLGVEHDARARSVAVRREPGERVVDDRSRSGAAPGCRRPAPGLARPSRQSVANPHDPPGSCDASADPHVCRWETQRRIGIEVVTTCSLW